MYDQFSSDYDRFVNWPARLAVEMPFIERQLQAVAPGVSGPARVLDAACGTGVHAIALAQMGYLAAGADLSTGMIERARLNASQAGANVRFEVAGFGDLARAFGEKSFEAVLCLGNSLPHLLTPAALAGALGDFAACLRPGGSLLIQNRNFDAVLARQERWMEPQAHRDGSREWLFLRFYDFDPDGLLAFHILTLSREESGPWEQEVTSTRLWPMRQLELATALTEAGFTQISWYGDMSGAPFRPGESGNLIATAILRRSYPIQGYNGESYKNAGRTRHQASQRRESNP